MAAQAPAHVDTDTKDHLTADALSSVPIPPGMIASVLNGVTYLTGSVKLPKTVAFAADDVQLVGDTKTAITSMKLTSTALATNGTMPEGYLVSTNDDVVTLALPKKNGAITTKFTQLMAPVYPVHTFATDGVTPVSLRLKYNKGLSCSLSSEVTSGATSYDVVQTIKITNDLQFDLPPLAGLEFSFQNRSEAPREYSRMAMAAPMAQARDSVGIAVGEISTPIKLGAIPGIPAKASVKMSFQTVTLNVLEVDNDVTLGSTTPTSTILFSVKSGTLYPSILYFLDENRVPIASTSVPMRMAGASFELPLGSRSNITVMSNVIGKDKYEVKLKSNVNYRADIRVTGWQLRGRVDSFTLEAGETKTFTGWIPKDE